MKRKLLHVFTLIFLLFLIFWACKGLFRYSFYQTHDLKRHMVRGYDAVMTIREGHFPLRWAGYTNFGCGVPTYNFYYPLFYYLVAIVNLFSGGVMLPVKIISFLSVLVGTFFFYLWIRKETGNRWAALSSSILYLFAPYRFSLILVRGDPEYLSYAILPVMLYFFANVFSAKKTRDFYLNAFGAAIAGGLLAISHNVVSVFVMPIVLLFLFIKIYLINRKIYLKQIIIVAFTFLSAFGLGAFFIFPAILEMRFTKIWEPIFNYKDHFPTLLQLINSKWGYGDSAIGAVLDGLSFQVGYAQWVVIGLVLLWLLFRVFRKKINTAFFRSNILVLFFFVLSLAFLFLMLSVSIPVWETLGISKILDFPWRLLGIEIFCVAALFGFWINLIKSKKISLIVMFGICVLAIYGNRNHLLAQPVFEEDLPFYQSLETFSPAKNTIPAFADNILAANAKISCDQNTPLIKSNFANDKISYHEINRGSTYGLINLNIEKSKIRGDKMLIGLSYFPGIAVFKINGQKVDYFDCEGYVCLNSSIFKNGENTISWKIGQTFVEKLSNSLSLLFISSWIYIIIFMFVKHGKK